MSNSSNSPDPADGWFGDDPEAERQATLALAHRLDRARKCGGKQTMTALRRAMRLKRAKSKAKGN